MNRRTHMARLVFIACAALIAGGGITHRASAQDGSAEVIGRVVDAEGDPIQGASIRVLEAVRLPQGARPTTRPVGRGSTDHTGAFLVRVRGAADLDRYLVEVLWRGTRRSVYPRHPYPVEVRMGPTRAVPVEVHCAERTVAWWPQIDVAWERDSADQTWIQGASIPAARGRAPGPVLPVTQAGIARLTPVPAGVVRFAARLRLPVGRSTLVLRSCGLETRVIEVPAAGPVTPVTVTLPHPESGAMELTQPGADSRLVRVRRDDAVVATLELGGPARLDGLAPGTYLLGPTGGRGGCQRSVAVRPGETAEVFLERDSCVSEASLGP